MVIGDKPIRLFVDARGQWRRDFWDARLKRSVPYYFGPVAEDPDGENAIAGFMQRKAAIENGTDRLRVTVTKADVTLGELARKFIDAKQEQVLAHQLADETFMDYRHEVNAFGEFVGNQNAVVKAFTPDHFALYAKHLRTRRKLGLDRQATVIRYIRAMFNYGSKQGWIPTPLFGVGFSAPNTTPEAKFIAAQRAGQRYLEKRIYKPSEIRLVLKALGGAASGPIKLGDKEVTFVANHRLRAMVLLALNTGMGPKDIARLSWSDISFKTGRLSMRRGKTAVRREAYLWKRTRKALLALGREGELVFYTRDGLPYVRTVRQIKGGRIKSVKAANAVSITYGRLMKRLGINDLRFYDLRATSRTIMEDGADMNAARRVMGKKLLGGSDARYVRGAFKLTRLKRMAAFVYRYVWQAKGTSRQQPTAKQNVADGV